MTRGQLPLVSGGRGSAGTGQAPAAPDSSVGHAEQRVYHDAQDQDHDDDRGGALHIGLIAGIDYTPPLLLRAGKMMGLRGLSLYRYLILPASLPAFVAGLRQGWAFAWRSLMAGELLVIIANQPSLGVLLSTYQDQADMEGATSIIIVILILGIVVHTLFGLADGAIRRRWGLTGTS